MYGPVAVLDMPRTMRCVYHLFIPSYLSGSVIAVCFIDMALILPCPILCISDHWHYDFNHWHDAISRQYFDFNHWHYVISRQYFDFNHWHYVISRQYYEFNLWFYDFHLRVISGRSCWVGCWDYDDSSTRRSGFHAMVVAVRIVSWTWRTNW